MHESLEEAQPVEQPSFKHLKDLPHQVFGEIRVDVDGNQWKWVRSHHTISEESAIGEDMLHFWERHLQVISDDAEAEAEERYGIAHKDAGDENDIAGRWQAMG